MQMLDQYLNPRYEYQYSSSAPDDKGLEPGRTQARPDLPAREYGNT